MTADRLSRPRLAAIVDELSALEGVRASIVVSLDGTPIDGVFSGEDAQLLGSLSGAIFATVNRTTQRTGLGELSDMVIGAGNGSILTQRAEDVVLVVLANARPQIGFIRLALKRAARELKGETETQ